MEDRKMQQVLNSLAKNVNEQETFWMLGIIFSFLFFIILGLATSQTIAVIF